MTNNDIYNHFNKKFSKFNNFRLKYYLLASCNASINSVPAFAPPLIPKVENHSNPFCIYFSHFYEKDMIKVHCMKPPILKHFLLIIYELSMIRFQDLVSIKSFKKILTNSTLHERALMINGLHPNWSQ